MKAGLIVILLIFGSLALWKISFPSGAWRYKMTVSVETPEGLKTGSAVREVSIQTGMRLSPQMLPEVRLKGEAVVVDLGRRGVLFALLSGYKKGDDYGDDIPAVIFSPTQAVMENKTIHYLSSLKAAGPVELPVEWYPKFVYFENASDPTTVKYLFKIELCSHQDSNIKKYCIIDDKLEEVFGQGVRLKSVTIEMLQAPVTEQINRFLPWLEEMEGGYLDGQPLGGGPELSNILHAGNFKQDR